MSKFLSRLANKASPNTQPNDRGLQEPSRLSLSPNHNGNGNSNGSTSRSPSPAPSFGGGIQEARVPPKFILNDSEVVSSPASMHRPESGSTWGFSYEEEKKRRAAAAHSRATSMSADSIRELDFPTPTAEQPQPPGLQMGNGNTPASPPTSVKAMSSRDRASSIASASSAASGESNGNYKSMVLPIVESPTQMIDKDHPLRARAASSYTPASDSLLPKPDADASSAVSIRSSGSKDGEQKKKSSWRRPSASVSTPPKAVPPRQMSGLASAIAASGMAMANPAATTNPFAGPNGTLAAPRAITRKGSASSMRSSVLSLPPKPEPRHTSNSSVSTRSRAASGSTAPGVSDNDDDDEDDSYDSADGLSMNEDDIPITGFAVASSKRNADFHELFPDVAEGDYLIEDYGCALQREILIQGRLYISENHVCFHANIFGWVTDLVLPFNEITVLEKKMTAFVIPNAIQVCTPVVKHTFASFLSRDTTFDVMHNIWRLARPEGSVDGSVRESLENGNGPQGNGAGGGGKARQATQCACGKSGQHAANVALECVLPGTPEQIYNLMFASGFIKDFMSTDQHLFDIQIADWAPSPPNNLLSRNMSYIKPLAGGFGPKQTKCEIKDETLHLDFDDHVTMLTVTRNPDVPSGNAFAVRTRTCIMWAGRGTTRIIVTCDVEWTARSFIKSIIEKASIDGNRQYHTDLEKAMRAYINEHRTEFLPEGVDAAAADQEAAAEEALVSPTSPTGPGSSSKGSGKELEGRGLQWALDTFKGTSKVAKDSFSGAIEILTDAFSDAWSTSSTTAILYVVVGVLLLSNLWTLRMVGKQEEVGRRKAMERKDAEKDRWVEEAVQSFIKVQQGIQNAAAANVVPSPVPSPIPLSNVVIPPAALEGASEQKLKDWTQEMSAISQAADELEARIARLKVSLQSVD